MTKTSQILFHIPYFTLYFDKMAKKTQKNAHHFSQIFDMESLGCGCLQHSLKIIFHFEAQKRPQK